MSVQVGGRWYENIDLLEGEIVVNEQGARYSRGAFTARGKLYLTTERLIFCPARNIIGPRNRPVAFQLRELQRIGTSGHGRFVRFFVLGRNTDSWFIEIAGERHWFDLGKGWNQMWAEKFAKRQGVPYSTDNPRD